MFISDVAVVDDSRQTSAGVDIESTEVVDPQNIGLAVTLVFLL